MQAMAMRRPAKSKYYDIQSVAASCTVQQPPTANPKSTCTLYVSMKNLH